MTGKEPCRLGRVQEVRTAPAVRGVASLTAPVATRSANLPCPPACLLLDKGDTPALLLPSAPSTGRACTHTTPPRRADADPLTTQSHPAYARCVIARLSRVKERDEDDGEVVRRPAPENDFLYCFFFFSKWFWERKAKGPKMGVSQTFRTSEYVLAHRPHAASFPLLSIRAVESLVVKRSFREYLGPMVVGERLPFWLSRKSPL